jgi:heat shock protein HtpX
MQYVGIMTQQRRNNFRSGLLLTLFPIIMLGMVFLFFLIMDGLLGTPSYDKYGNISSLDWDSILADFSTTIPWVILIIGVWFLISYFSNVSMVRHAVGARPLDRQENPRIYNLVENLCMSCGMNTPKINVIDDEELNAFASGIDEKSYTVTLTTGIINRLDDAELEGVIGHELTHIRNKDTRLLIISIVFVGILAALSTILWKVIVYLPRLRGNGKSRAGIYGIMLIALVCCAIGYFFTIVTRFAISRKREYMADAGSAELTGNPQALASALRKISDNPALQDTKREDVAQLFIFHSPKQGFFNSLFSTHPDINERIRILEQF